MTALTNATKQAIRAAMRAADVPKDQRRLATARATWVALSDQERDAAIHYAHHAAQLRRVKDAAFDALKAHEATLRADLVDPYGRDHFAYEQRQQRSPERAALLTAFEAARAEYLDALRVLRIEEVTP